MVPLLKLWLRDVQAVVDHVEKDALSRIDFRHGQPSNLGPGRVSVRLVLHKLGGDHQAGQEHASSTVNVRIFPVVVVILLLLLHSCQVIINFRS